MRKALALSFALAVSSTLGLGLGCASVLSPASHLDYFAAPSPGDAWSPKIRGWQRRERADLAAPSLPMPPVAGPGQADAEDASSPTTEPDRLRGKYASFRAEQRRAMARELAAWIQEQARTHYVADGAVDHWATLEETLRSDGDDCDGLELLVFHALRDLGFGDHEVYRAIVFRPADGQHHMVTLWFERRDDPWVIDPTGAMVSGMHRMSQIPGWVPLKVFSDTSEYSVRTVPAPAQPVPLAASR